MTAYLLTNHLLNFVAPAAAVAVLMTLLAAFFGRIFKSKSVSSKPVGAQIATLFAVNLGVLVAGLLFFGNDAKMASYAVMVIAAGVCRWVMLQSWKH